MDCAYYDLSTDTIHGCKEGTLSYFHEEGHQAWAKKGIEQSIQQFQWAFVLVLLPILAAFTKNFWFTVFASVPLIFFIISELHAWFFGLSKWFKVKNA